MKKFFLFLIGIGLFIWIGKTVGWMEIKKAFLVFTGWQGLVIFGLTFLIALVKTWKWREILKGTDTKISFGELFKPHLASFSLMYLLPVMALSGEIFRSYVLRKKNQVSWSNGIASIVIERILDWTVNLVIIFFGILFFLFIIGFPQIIKLAIIWGGVFLFLAGGISYFYFKIRRRESFAKVFIKIFNQRLDNQPLEIEKEIFDFFKSKKKVIWKSFGLTFLKTGIMWFRTWLLIFFLGEKISILPALSILSFSYLAETIPIPAALGSHEAIQTFAFNFLGLGIGKATAFTMIIRAADLLIALIGVIILYRLGIDLLRNTLFKKVKTPIEIWRGLKIKYN